MRPAVPSAFRYISSRQHAHRRGICTLYIAASIAAVQHPGLLPSQSTLDESQMPSWSHTTLAGFANAFTDPEFVIKKRHLPRRRLTIRGSRRCLHRLDLSRSSTSTAREHISLAQMRQDCDSDPINPSDQVPGSHYPIEHADVQTYCESKGAILLSSVVGVVHLK